MKGGSESKTGGTRGGGEIYKHRNIRGVFKNGKDPRSRPRS